MPILSFVHEKPHCSTTWEEPAFSSGKMASNSAYSWRKTARSHNVRTRSSRLNDGMRRDSLMMTCQERQRHTVFPVESCQRFPRRKTLVRICPASHIGPSRRAGFCRVQGTGRFRPVFSCPGLDSGYFTWIVLPSGSSVPLIRTFFPSWDFTRSWRSMS